MVETVWTMALFWKDGGILEMKTAPCETLTFKPATAQCVVKASRRRSVGEGCRARPALTAAGPARPPACLPELAAG